MPFDGLEAPFSYLAKFDQVIDLIESPEQWTKHTYKTPRGQYCLKEALNTVGIAEIFEPIILRAAEKATEREYCCIESFNDHPETTHGDVVAVLHRTRVDVAAGKVRLPPRRAGNPPAQWQEHQAPVAASRASPLWRRMFSWG